MADSATPKKTGQTNPPTGKHGWTALRRLFRRPKKVESGDDQAALSHTLPHRGAPAAPVGSPIKWGIVLSSLIAVAIILALWQFAPGLRSLLFTIAIVVGVVGIFPGAYLAYLGFTSDVQRQRLREDFSLLGLVPENELYETVDKLYATAYSPVQFLTYSLLIVLVSLLVIGSYLWRDRISLVPADALVLAFYALLGAYVFSIQELVRRYNTFDLQPQVYSSILVRLLVAVTITGASAAVIQISGQTLATSEGGDALAWASVIAFVIGVFPSRGLRWLTTQANKVLAPNNPAETELPLRNLLGLNALHEARFAQMGIDDAQNLATADLRRLLLTTQFDALQIVHWVDQAILYTKVGAKLQRFRDANLPTFYEYRRAVNALALKPTEARTQDEDKTNAEARTRLAAVLGLANADELERLADDDNYTNHIHIAQYYIRREELARRRSSHSLDTLTGQRATPDYAATIESLRALSDQDTNNPGLRNDLGYAYYQWSLQLTDPLRQASLQCAERAYDQALALDSNHAVALYNRSLIYVGRQGYDEAVRDCTSAISLGAANADAYNNRGLAHSRLGYLDLALADLNQALRLNQRLGVAYLNRGVVYNTRGGFAEADHDFSHANLLGVSQAELWIAWGIALINLKQFDEAIERLSHAVNDPEQGALAFARRGYAYYEFAVAGDVAAGKPAELLHQAELDFGRALKRKPELLEARLNYGQVLARQERYLEAVTQFDQVIAVAGSPYKMQALHHRAAAWNRLALLDASRGQAAEAKDHRDRSKADLATIISEAPPNSPELADAILRMRSSTP